MVVVCLLFGVFVCCVVFVECRSLICLRRFAHRCVLFDVLRLVFGVCSALIVAR